MRKKKRMRQVPIAWILVVVGAASCAAQEAVPAGAEGIQPPPEAVARLAAACDSGRADACAKVGNDYFFGQGAVPQDQARAIAYFEKACALDGGAGCCFLGRAYGRGEGVAEDPARSAEYYQKACAAGVVGACNSLGFLYHDGSGVPKDVARAAELWRGSCRAKCREACDCETLEKCRWESAAGCYFLGNAHAKGEGAPVDPARALELFERGCEAKIANACFEAGAAYSAGKGVRPNKKRARSYFMKACDQGHSAGCAFGIAGL